MKNKTINTLIKNTASALVSTLFITVLVIFGFVMIRGAVIIDTEVVLNTLLMNSLIAILLGAFVTCEDVDDIIESLQSSENMED